MGNESDKTGTDAVWSMPEPIFRSSAGNSLRGPKPDVGDIENEMITNKEPEINMDNEEKDVVEATTDPQGENAIEKEERGDKLGASMTAVGLLALLGAAVVFLLVYFLFFRTVVPDAQ